MDDSAWMTGAGSSSALDRAVIILLALGVSTVVVFVCLQRRQAQLQLLQWAIRRPFHRCAACHARNSSVALWGGLQGRSPCWLCAECAFGVQDSTRFLGAADNWVLKLPAGSSTWVGLPPSGLFQPRAVAADTAGGVDVTAPADNWVLKLPAGSSTRVELPPSGLFQPWAVVADTAGRRGHMTWRRRLCDAVVLDGPKY